MTFWRIFAVLVVFASWIFLTIPSIDDTQTSINSPDDFGDVLPTKFADTNETQEEPESDRMNKADDDSRSTDAEFALNKTQDEFKSESENNTEEQNGSTDGVRMTGSSDVANAHVDFLIDILLNLLLTVGVLQPSILKCKVWILINSVFLLLATAGTIFTVSKAGYIENLNDELIMNILGTAWYWVSVLVIVKFVQELKARRVRRRRLVRVVHFKLEVVIHSGNDNLNAVPSVEIMKE